MALGIRDNFLARTSVNHGIATNFSEQATIVRRQVDCPFVGKHRDLGKPSFISLVVQYEVFAVFTDDAVLLDERVSIEYAYSKSKARNDGIRRAGAKLAKLCENILDSDLVTHDRCETATGELVEKIGLSDDGFLASIDFRRAWSSRPTAGKVSRIVTYNLGDLTQQVGERRCGVIFALDYPLQFRCIPKRFVVSLDDERIVETRFSSEVLHTSENRGVGRKRLLLHHRRPAARTIRIDDANFLIISRSLIFQMR